MKTVLGENTNHWNNFYTNAAICRTRLSDFTQNALNQFKNKDTFAPKNLSMVTSDYQTI
jgi:hypothetical protein